jgi:fluoride exporter
MLGTALRLGLDSILHQPLSTLLINVVGSLALGFLTARVWPTAPPWLKAGLGPGLLGSFTTFSAFAVQVVALGFSLPSLLYVALTVALGLAAAFLGLRLGRRS